MSLGLGVFIGIIPAWGFQTFLCITLAIFFKWNKAITFLGSNISIPPMIPVIVYFSLVIGGWVLSYDQPPIFDFREANMEMVKIHFLQYVLGSILLAIFAAVVAGTFFYMALKYYRSQQENDNDR